MYIQERPTDPVFGHDSSRLVARLSRFRPALPHGADRTSRWHSQTKLRVTKIFAYYSAAFRKTLSSRAYFRGIIYLPRAERDLYATPLLLLLLLLHGIYHLQLHAGIRSGEETRGGRGRGGDEKLTDRLSCSSSFP